MLADKLVSRAKWNLEPDLYFEAEKFYKTLYTFNYCDFNNTDWSRYF